MSAFDFSSARWRKSSHSGQEGTECVEVARLSRAVAVRDSKDPEGPKLAFSRSEWRAFVEAWRPESERRW
ncbi:MAG TPA: DUF397 domain-containing protein [Streptosporangiaceae bacterium]